tara:strand:- start:133 stop:279 length:147 start_codon:yes stop_codon:yes gene_type:complete
VDFSNVVSIFGKGAYSSGDVSDWASLKGKNEQLPTLAALKQGITGKLS